jgi:hypothetical protein
LHEAHVDLVGQRRRSTTRPDRAEMVARLAGQVLAGGEICSALRHDQQRVAGNQHDGRS